MLRSMVSAGLLASVALAMTPVAAADGVPTGLTVDRAVLLMRHGVRPPTNAQPLPPAVTPETWPDWPTRPGWLTPHGAVAVGRIGAGTARDSAAWGCCRVPAARRRVRSG